jgi:hypothetical protein
MTARRVLAVSCRVVSYRGVQAVVLVFVVVLADTGYAPYVSVESVKTTLRVELLAYSRED